MVPSIYKLYCMLNGVSQTPGYFLWMTQGIVMPTVSGGRLDVLTEQSGATDTNFLNVYIIFHHRAIHITPYSCHEFGLQASGSSKPCSMICCVCNSNPVTHLTKPHSVTYEKEMGSNSRVFTIVTHSDKNR